MVNKKKITSFFITLIFTLSLVFNNILGINITANANTLDTQIASATQVSNTIDEGAILHAWNWSFNTIKAKLPEIKAAGYKAVQTSPIQGNKEDLMDVSKWWILYQPTNFKIGNAQLGNRDEFKSMCDAAEQEGIKIIVDVVANHTGNRGGGDQCVLPAYNVDPEILNNSSFWHEAKRIDNYKDRWQVTQWGIDLPDLNTSNHDLQDKVINFLNDAIACGADGFRFDAAKHIELPSDPSGSDFWPRVLGSLNNKNNLFIYGEVLQGDADNYNGYYEYMKTTLSNYGGSVRSAVGFYGSANANSARNYTATGSSSNFITWVESHDTFANDHKETTGLSNEQIKLAWAMIAGRAESTPLFFNRPAGGYGVGKLGAAGDDLWKDPIVVAANNFRNLMAGKSEYVRTQGNDLFITERGTSGAMIVNVSNNEVALNSETTLPVGEYKDSVSGKNFKVVSRDGKNYFDGSVKVSGRNIAAITSSTPQPLKPEVSSSVVTGAEFVNSINVTLNAKNTTSATYSVDGINQGSYTNGKAITLGADKSIGEKVTLKLYGTGEDGTKVEGEYVYTKVEKKDNGIAKIKLPSGWTAANIYVYDESVTPTKEVAKWPGVAMTNEGNGVYSYTIPDGYGEKTQVIFNNGSNQIPAAQLPGLYIAPGQTKIYEDGSWKDLVVDPKVSSSVATSTTFKTSLEVTLTATNTATATYSIDGVDKGTFTNGQKITLGKDAKAGDVVTLKLTGTSSTGKTAIAEYKYTKVDTKETIAKIKLPSGWTSANIYVYDESVSPTKEVAKWPGVAMTNEGNGIYSYTLPEGWTDKTQVIFNCGSNQIPAAKEPGFYIAQGESRIYENGSWNLVANEAIKINSFEANKLSPQIADTTINLTSNATGGSGSLQYKFTCKESSSTTEKTIKEYSSVSSAEWTPTVAGSYEVKVTVKDSNGNTETQVLNFQITERPSDITLNEIVLDKEEGIVSELVTLSAEATGGIGNLSYKFYYKKDDKYVMIKDYSSEKIATWIPTEAGTYSVRVEVIDSAGNLRVVGKNFVVKEKELQELTATIAVTKTESPVNQEVTISSTSNGGAGSTLYKFYYKKDGKYTKIQDFSYASSVTWTPTEEGNYVLFVEVKDKDEQLVTKTINFVATKAVVEDVKIQEVKLSKTSVKVGESVDITTIATGGENLKYRVAIHDFNDAWTTLHDFKAENITTWTPLISGEHVIWVDVIDENGSYSSEKIDVIVNE